MTPTNFSDASSLETASPSLQRVMQGRMQRVMRCTNGCCAGKRWGKREDFSWLPLRVKVGDRVVCSVQETIDLNGVSAVVANVTTPCVRCGRGSITDPQIWNREYKIHVLPSVLMVLLNRWGGAGHTGACLDPIEASVSIMFHGRSYSFCVVVYHVGHDPCSGYYIVVTKHRQGAEDWWIFDDCSRRLAKPNEVIMLKSPFHSYICFHELV